jgi:hypothetical protein
MISFWVATMNNDMHLTLSARGSFVLSAPFATWNAVHAAFRRVLSRQIFTKNVVESIIILCLMCRN